MSRVPVAGGGEPGESLAASRTGQARVAGKVAVVTGAGSIGDGWGNGMASAVLYAREGARVVLVDRNPVALDRTLAAITQEGGSAVAVCADVSTSEGVEAYLAAAMDSFGRVDILHNNVGVGVVAPLVESDEAKWDLVLRINTKSVYLGCRSAIPLMIKGGGGSIVNISSIASIRWTGAQFAAYSASKAAINQLTQAVAMEHIRDGIRCNAVVVGYVDTPTVYAGMAPGADAQTRAELKRTRDAACPMGFMGSPWDVAYASLFLASEEARYITATQLVVDGGASAWGFVSA